MNGNPLRPAADAASDDTSALAVQLAPLRAWWRGLAAREQRLVVLAALAVACLLLWVIAIRPAWTTVRQTPAQLDVLDHQLQSMQRLAAEARELRAAPTIPQAQAQAALQVATARLGEGARLAIQADRAVLSVTGIEADALRSWLAEVRSGARARPVEAQLARGPKGFTGTVTLAIVGGP